MRLTLRSLAALLAYPSAELTAHIEDIRQAIARERTVPRAVRQRLEPLLRRLETEDLLDLQADYSELFDRSRSLSLHLFEHVHGDSRDRGQALIDLGQQYIDAGYLLDSTELPDFVPVFVEFTSCLDADDAREMLGQPAHVFAALEERLARRGSDYAAVFQTLIAVAGAHPDAEALAELQENAPSDDLSKIDEEWEEAPVTFTQPVPEVREPPGIIARIKMAGDALAAATKRTGGSA